MLAVKGIYEDGKIRLLQDVGNIKKARAYVILIPEEENTRDKEGVRRTRRTQQIKPIKIKGEALAETIVKERYHGGIKEKDGRGSGWIHQSPCPSEFRQAG